MSLTMLATAGNFLVRLLLAPSCAACRTELALPLKGPVCERCWASLPKLRPPLCDWCGDRLPTLSSPYLVCERCLAAPPAFDAARSAGLYDGALRALIHAYKYDRRRLLAPALASLIRRAGRELLEDADAVVPVPLHPWRLVQRGFNQADDLAVHLNLPVWRVLRRARHGPPQATLDARHRAHNVVEAFASRRHWSIVPTRAATSRLRAATVVLIDDVMTTGATMDACSRVLMERGVKSVRALTVARAVALPRGSRAQPPHPSSLRHR